MIRFIDLFAGIGGFRLALESVGATCVFSAENNAHACDMYEKNFSENPLADVTSLDEKALPDFDILCAGFPCQAFSIAGKKKGFSDSRGNLFFELCRIIAYKKPSVVLLENVKNLHNHDAGNTFSVIKKSLLDLEYTLSYQVLSAKDFGLPQHRERIIIVAVRNDLKKQFDFSLLEKHRVEKMKNFLDTTVDTTMYLNSSEYTLLEQEHIKRQEKSGLIFCGYRNKNIRKKGVVENSYHHSRTHKQSSRIYDADGIHPTLSSQESSGRYFIKVDNAVRKLSINECYRIMGFPDNFIKTGSKANIYARIGNSVCVNMIAAVAKQIKQQIFE